MLQQQSWFNQVVFGRDSNICDDFCVVGAYIRSRIYDLDYYIFGLWQILLCDSKYEVLRYRIFQISCISNRQMLQYRQYLNQSRAIRSSRPTQSIPQPSNRQVNIQDLVSKPGYGQIFYSQENKAKLSNNIPDKNSNNTNANANATGNNNVIDANTHLKSSLKLQKNRNEEMVRYMYELQEQNTLLKQKLMEVLGRGYDAMPNYITSSIPSESYLPQQQVQNKQKNQGSATNLRNNGKVFNAKAVISPKSQQRPGSSLPNPSQLSIPSPAQPLPTFPLNAGSFRPVTPPPSAQQQLGCRANMYGFGLPAESIPYYYPPPNMAEHVGNVNSNQVSGRNTNGNSNNYVIRNSNSQRNEQSGLIQIAKTKLEEIKQEDEELRMFTLKLLKKYG